MDATCKHTGEDVLTSIINLWAGPGTGKSRTAAGLFNLMKYKGHKVELVTEVAKFLTYERNLTALNDQFIVMAQQEYTQRIIADSGVDWIVTDSPVMQGVVYAPEADRRIIRQCCDHFRKRYTNHDVFLKRDTTRAYEIYGRNQTLEQAQDLDADIRAIFSGASHYAASLTELVASVDAPEVIYERVVKPHAP